MTLFYKVTCDLGKSRKITVGPNIKFRAVPDIFPGRFGHSSPPLPVKDACWHNQRCFAIGAYVFHKKCHIISYIGLLGCVYQSPVFLESFEKSNLGRRCGGPHTCRWNTAPIISSIM